MFGNQNLISTGEKMEVEKVWEKKKKKTRSQMLISLTPCYSPESWQDGTWVELGSQKGKKVK